MNPVSNPPNNPSAPHRLIDQQALRQHRDRADRLGRADPLHRIALDEVQDRLAEINRPFTRVGIVTAWPEFWQTAFPDAHVTTDSERLDLPDGLDLVIHVMALHWAEDPVGQIVQSARALKPDGLFIAAIPGSGTLQELREVLLAAESEMTGGASPRVIPFPDVRDVGALLQRGGFALPVTDKETYTVRYDSIFPLMKDLRAMGMANPLTGRSRRPLTRGILLRAAELYAERFSDPDGRIRASFSVIYVSGWAPHESQQKPLKPGSATMRLADALKQTGGQTGGQT